ncbi:hypothetical protein V8E36_009714 [Tilletia maclaganii]
MNDFNFTGSTAPQRHINLGGASAGSTRSQAQLAAAARAERAQREIQRKREASARRIQAAWRARASRDVQSALWHAQAQAELGGAAANTAEVEHVVRLVVFATRAGVAARHLLSAEPSAIAQRRTAARLDAADVRLLLRAAQTVVLNAGAQPRIAGVAPKLVRIFLNQLLAALFTVTRQPSSSESQAAAETILQSFLKLMQQGGSSEQWTTALVHDDLYPALSALLLAIPAQQKTAPAVKLAIDTALAPLKLITASASVQDRQLAVSRFTANILSIQHLPNRIPIPSLSQIVAATPFDEVLGAIIALSASSPFDASVLASPHLLANIMVVGGGAKRIAMFKTGVQLCAYLDALRLMQNALPAHVFLGPSTAQSSVASSKGKGKAVQQQHPPAAAGTAADQVPGVVTPPAEVETDAAQGLFDDERSRARAERLRTEARTASSSTSATPSTKPSKSNQTDSIDKTTYNRLLTLTSDAHLSAIIGASSRFSATSRPALCSFFCSIVTAGWPVAVRERALGGIIYSGSQSSAGAQGHQVGGFIRELWRGYIRGGTLARMLGAGPQQALQTLSTSHLVSSPTPLPALSGGVAAFRRGDGADSSVGLSTSTAEALRREWPALVLICELYSRALLTMGDAEFMPPVVGFEASTSSSSSTSSAALASSNSSSMATAGGASASTSSLGLKNPLTTDEVVSLSALLRNLVFAMFWYEGTSSVFTAPAPESSSSTTSTTNNTSTEKPQPNFSKLYLNGFKLKLADLRALLTKVLQQLYTRDSRRRFTPVGHWEMLSQNDLQAFINTVILEEQELTQGDEDFGGGGGGGATDVDGARANRLRDRAQAELMDLDLSEDDDDDEEMENEDPRRAAVEGALLASVAGPARNLPVWQRMRNQQARGGGGGGGGLAGQRLTSSMMAFLSPRLGVLNNIPFVIPFEVRVEIFRQFIRNDRARLDIDRYHPFDMGRPVNIRRGHVAEDGFRGLHRLGSSLKQRIQIQFVDQFGNIEAGIDGGGLFKEFLTSLVREAFDTNRGLWKATADQAIYPNPHNYAKQPEQLEWYVFLGRVLGKAIYEGILVDIKFASFFLSKWLGKQSYLDDLASLDSLDPELAKGLNFVLRAYTGDFEDLALNFTVTDDEFGVSTTTELVPGGAQIPVTRENRLEYVYRVSHYRLSDQIEKQSAAFFSGLSEMVDPRWLRMMSREELRVLVSGAEAPIDVDDLRANTVYGGFHEQDLTIQYFWAALKSFDPQMRKAFLKFVTSCPSPPLLGFAHLSPKFAIRMSGSDETRLPTASTCVNLLKLPAYSSLEQVAAKLRYVCTIEVGFDLS